MTLMQKCFPGFKVIAMHQYKSILTSAALLTTHFVLGKITSSQCVTVPKMLNDTDTDTFIRYQIFSIPIPVLFRYQIFSIPVPRLFSDTQFYRYRFRDFFPAPNFSDTGSDTTRKRKISRYRSESDRNSRENHLDFWGVPGVSFCQKVGQNMPSGPF